MVLDCDSAFLDGVPDETATPETWTVAVLVGKETVEFKLDTGAEVTATSDFSFRKLKGIHLQKQSKVLHKMDLIVLRYLFWDSSHNYSLLRTSLKTSQQQVIVVKGLNATCLAYLRSNLCSLWHEWTRRKATQRELLLNIRGLRDTKRVICEQLSWDAIVGQIFGLFWRNGDTLDKSTKLFPACPWVHLIF